ncbi:HAMP domain-containing sensor histidine kinase [Singulisphaera sp. Ch08]|uniref:histidine kinase n=1 Tax=Singulisphaera sp. Ch08 TaxID=3120278 RepID=A0AAU7CLX3_9BACT
MRKHLGWIWLAFGLCVTLAALAMTRVGTVALDLERAESRIRRQAALDENLQLALWRMDSALAPLIAEEGMRPYFTYTSFYPAERAYNHMLEVLNKGDVLVASPLLTYSSPRIRLHFQFGPDGRLNSPQVPEGNMRALADSRLLPTSQIDAAAIQLNQLRGLVSEPAMELCCSPEPTLFSGSKNILGMFPAQSATDQSRGSIEYMMRSRNKVMAQAVAPERSLATEEPVLQAAMEAAWIGESLILGRRVQVGSKTFLQGCWLNWEAIRAELLGSVADLVPNAMLEPVQADDQAPTRRLAALPARLVLRPAEADVPMSWSPVRLSLGITWACLIFTTGAVALLLGGALALSERRGTFVSAVTHELRTPLTTFQLYTEMLAEGMVSDPETQASYLQTLRTESERLGHLVENVLAFACIERGRAIERRDVLAVADLIARVQPALAARADRGGMKLIVGHDLPDVQVRTDVSLVEQILTNLVDNAAKYANNAGDRRIELEFAVAPSHSKLTISVRDHGPGLPERATRRLFRPFSKSAHDAAHSAPGVGLGLALSRRLARALGGDLRLGQNGPDGVGFVLLLPIEA